ncbi:hypothetical protein I3842_04G167500 [Carya illinoinensis]|uniref:Uncharacterized protein n=1 Tax=Carya illinoinensis TaxID=32201 RepID=A0A922FDF2_CARIL|nr:hypothetical protein I3842_04G167500 [Carya illinoinensis]
MKIKYVVAAIFFIGCSLTVFTQNFASAYAEELDSSHYQVTSWDPYYAPDPPTDDFGWADECFSDYHTMVQCALSSGFNPIDAANGYEFDVDSECCKVLKEFDEDCVSDSPSFDDLSRSFSWMRDSCRRHHHHHNRHRHGPRHSTPPSTPSPKPTPPRSTPSPPSPKPTPPPSNPSPPSPSTPTPPSPTTPSPPSTPTPTSPTPSPPASPTPKPVPKSPTPTPPPCDP